MASDLHVPHSDSEEVDLIHESDQSSQSLPPSNSQQLHSSSLSPRDTVVQQYTEQDATAESGSESELEGMADHYQPHHEVMHVQEETDHYVQEDTPNIHLLYSDSEGSSMEDSDISFSRTGFQISSSSAHSDSQCGSSNVPAAAVTVNQEDYDDVQQSSNGSSFTDSRRKRPRLTLSEHEAAEARKQKNSKHNHNERIRRSELKDLVVRLRNQLQKRRTKRPTTIKVLEAAIQEITELKTIEAEEERELEALKRTQNHLTWRLERLMSEHNAPSSPSSAPAALLSRPSLPNPPVVVPPPFVPQPTAVPFSTGEARPGFFQTSLLRYSPFQTPPVSLSPSLQPGVAGSLLFRSPHFPYSILPFAPSHIPSPPTHSSAEVRPSSPMNIMMPIYPGLYPSTGYSRYAGTAPAPHFPFPIGALPPLHLSSSSSSNQPTLPFHFSLSSSTTSASSSGGESVSSSTASRRHEESHDCLGDHRSTGELDEHSELTHRHQHFQRQHENRDPQQEETGSPKNGVTSAEPFLSHLKRRTTSSSSVQESAAAVQGSAEEESKNEDRTLETERENHTERLSGHNIVDVETITENSGSCDRGSISVIHHVSRSPRGSKEAHKKVARSRKNLSKNGGPPPLVKINNERRGVERQEDKQETMSEIIFENGHHLPMPPQLKRDKNTSKQEAENESGSEECVALKRRTRYSLNFKTESCPLTDTREGSKFKLELTRYCHPLTNESQYH